MITDNAQKEPESDLFDELRVELESEGVIVTRERVVDWATSHAAKLDSMRREEDRLEPWTAERVTGMSLVDNGCFDTAKRMLSAQPVA